jgi:hypothetical protein
LPGRKEGWRSQFASLLREDQCCQPGGAHPPAITTGPWGLSNAVLPTSLKAAA